METHSHNKNELKKLLLQAKVEHFCVGYGLLHQINHERKNNSRVNFSPSTFALYGVFDFKRLATN